jgi:hypothetical protein
MAMGDTDRRTTIRELMASGVLPHESALSERPASTSTPRNWPSRVLVGGPRHEPCTICGGPGLQVQYFYVAGQVVTVHAACDGLWKQERAGKEDPMKLRDLKRQVGKTSCHVWPPLWSSSYGADSRFATGDEGVLKGVQRWDSRLSLTMTYDGREHMGNLEWDPPPALADVEKALAANLGREIKAISDVDV